MAYALWYVDDEGVVADDQITDTLEQAVARLRGFFDTSFRTGGEPQPHGGGHASGDALALQHGQRLRAGRQVPPRRGPRARGGTGADAEQHSGLSEDPDGRPRAAAEDHRAGHDERYAASHHHRAGRRDDPDDAARGLGIGDDRSAARAERIARYRRQLAAYAVALEQVLGEPIVAGLLVHCRTSGAAEQIELDDWPAAIYELRRVMDPAS